MIKRTLVFVMLTLLTYAFVHAQGRQGGHGGPGEPGRPGGFGLPFRELGLTDAQMQQIKTIQEQEFQATSDLRDQVKTEMDALRALETAATFDAAAYKTAALALADTQAELMTAQATANHQIYTQVLTQDQRDKLKQLEQNHPQGPPPGPGSPSGFRPE